MQPYKILDAIAEVGTMELILTGGEPSLHPDFLEIVESACDKFSRVMIQSNGTNFSKQTTFNVLSQHNLFCLNYSLHGPQSVHDRLTSTPGSFAKTVRALSLAVKAGKRTASNLVLTALNTEPDILRQTVEILASIGVQEMTLTRFIPCGTGREAINLTVSIQDFVCALRTLQEATRYYNISLLLGNSTPACRLPKDLHSLCNRCSFGFDKFYVDAHGNLMVCGMSRIVLGNLLDNSIRTILASSEVYEQYLSNLHVPEKCRRCIDFEICGGGCRAAALAENGKLYSEDRLNFSNTTVKEVVS
jgi:radical SAM protein with 4Fe4S-binding SPASM domain